MELVFTDKKVDNFIENTITGFYGDVVDLLRLGIDVEGIIYDDEWTVKRFLNGHRLKLNSRIDGIFKYLELDKRILNIKLKNLSKCDFKFVLLAKLLINNKKIIIFDYFEVGLTYKDQKRLIRIMRTLKHDGITLIIISKNLVFMNQIVDSIQVVKDEEIIYNGKMLQLVKDELIDDPEIIKFIKLANKKGANLDITLDSKELLKDIYRSVY